MVEYNDTDLPDFVKEPPSKKFKNEKKFESKVPVKLVNTTIYEGRYLVYRVDDISQVFLVPTEHLLFSVSEQLIDEALLINADKPYDWNGELTLVWPTVDQVRLAVYRNGLIKKEDLSDPQLAQMALYGAFPNRFKGE